MSWQRRPTKSVPSAKRRLPLSISISRFRLSSSLMLTADFFDGHSTRVRKVVLRIDEQTLFISGENIEVQVPFSEVRVDERLGRAPRRLRFSDGAVCGVKDIHGA